MTPPSIQTLIDQLYQNDVPGNHKTDAQFVAAVDPTIFQEIAGTLSSLDGDALEQACFEVKTGFARPLECDTEYGHWGIGMAGMKKIEAALSIHEGCAPDKKVAIMRHLAGESTYQFNSQHQMQKKLSR